VLEVILRFTERTKRHAQIPCEIAGFIAAEALRDIRWRRFAGTPELIAEIAVSLHLRARSKLKHPIAQRDRKPPGIKIFVRPGGCHA
jgi:hypothetical protein